MASGEEGRAFGVDQCAPVALWHGNRPARGALGEINCHDAVLCGHEQVITIHRGETELVGVGNAEYHFTRAAWYGSARGV